MANRANPQLGKYPAYIDDKGRVFPVERFGSIIKVWALQAATQLHDAYKTQKLWNGTRENAVWVNQKQRRTRATTAKKNGKSYKVKPTTFGSWSWYEESKYRQMQDTKPGSSRGKYWYSTGHSAEVSDVKVVNATMEDAEIAFHTTAGALFAEAGVGLNGPFATRGSRASKGRRRIKVDRAAPWTHKRRYVTQWEPSAGRTHRPSTRQQVSLLKRRLKWAANKIYCRDLAIYLGYTMEDAWRKLGKIPVFTGHANGSFEIKPAGKS